MARQHRKRKSLLSPNPWWALAVLLLALLVLIALQVTGITHFFAKNKQNGISSDKNPYSLPVDNGTSGNQPTSKQNGGGILVDPSGDLVSNHKPNLSGSPSPSTEQSVCSDVPSAICQISFSKDGVTKSLAPKQIDNSGAAYWNWKLQDIGLTVGSWQITAKATLNGSSKTGTDSLALEVSP